MKYMNINVLMTTRNHKHAITPRYHQLQPNLKPFSFLLFTYRSSRSRYNLAMQMSPPSLFHF